MIISLGSAFDPDQRQVTAGQGAMPVLALVCLAILLGLLVLVVALIGIARALVIAYAQIMKPLVAVIRFLVLVLVGACLLLAALTVHGRWDGSTSTEAAAASVRRNVDPAYGGQLSSFCHQFSESGEVLAAECGHPA